MTSAAFDVLGIGNAIVDIIGRCSSYRCDLHRTQPSENGSSHRALPRQKIEDDALLPEMERFRNILSQWT